ncbi:RND transporter [Geomonas limicola]|uniref:RND transporter n=1 Tax=Geomonas limicola TaxID=2740186 RepID=A0A6V8N685_9BACT|nr:efflux RND transporter periplasmic adaptor subunit [Geomonas limicola]GFO67327.1 RND transporter [Geomonas limicola]
MRVATGGALALILLAALGCSKSNPEAAQQKAPVLVRGATVAALAQEQIPELQEAVGTVRARNSAVVAARLSGTVSAVQVREGERVPKGKVLVTIEAAESGAAAAGAQAAVEEAQRGVDEARSRKRLAEATFERYRKLYAEQALTRQEFEERQMEQEVAQQGLARAEARLRQTRESARAAGTVAGYGKVTSPIAGVVVAKPVEAGQTVFPGTPLITVEGDGGYRLEVAAAEGLLGKVKPGDQVTLDLEGAPAAGRVSEIVPLVDPASRTFLVKIDLSGKALRAGAYGKAYFRTGSRQGIAVPAKAVVERGALTSVWVVGQGGIARLRLVKLGKTIGGKVEVLSGLNAGERIVVAGAEQVSDGARLE